MNIQFALCIINGITWGYLAGRAAAWLMDNTPTGGIRIPIATSIVNGLANGINWYIRAAQNIVNGLAASIDRVTRKLAR